MLLLYLMHSKKQLDTLQYLHLLLFLQLYPGIWQGPVRSGYGVHLVRIKDFLPARIPEFKKISSRVMTEYMNDFRLKANDKAVEELKSRYRIIVTANNAVQGINLKSASIDSSGGDS